MTKVKKLLFGLGGVALMATPVVAVTSCAGGAETPKFIDPATKDTSSGYVSSDIGNVKSTFSSQIEEIKNKVSEINSGKSKNIPIETLKKLINNQPIMHITSSAGVINDNSFNQMTWESVSEFSRLTGVKTSTYTETRIGSDSEMFSAYDNALNNGYKIWVLTGWSQESPFSKWLNRGNNAEKLKVNKVKIIAIDWDASKYVSPGSAISLNFKTQESSFLVGYSVAKYLAEKFPGDENKDKRIVNTSSGADASGSTNFNYGFLEGIRAWNKEQSDNTTKISTNIYTNDEKIWLNTTYSANAPAQLNDFNLSFKGGGNQVYKGSKPTVVMPVAGDWSRTAAQGIIQDEQWVVGVDSDMATSYGSELRNKFITSSEKRIAIATFKALCFVTGLSTEIGDSALFPDGENTSWDLVAMDDSGLIVNNKTKSVENMNIIGGIAEGYVGASKSTISNTEDAKRFDEIVKETETKFFGESGSLKQVDSAKLEAYKNAATIDAYNKAVFELENVYYGQMTTNNKGYFNMIADEINKWLK